MHGPQFIVALSDAEVSVIRRAFDKVSDEHEANPDGFDNYIMGRRERILEELNQGGFGLFAGGPGGWENHPEKSFPLTQPEMTLIGIAISRDRYREAPMEEPERPALVARIMNWFMSTALAQEIRPKMVTRLDGLAENVDCYIQNTAAIKLFDKIAATPHSYPGGHV